MALATLAIAAILQGGPPRAVFPQPITHRDLPYVANAHERQKLDLFVLPNSKHRPLIVVIHGGGFQSGSKSQINPMPYLREGFNVASIGYRLSGDALFPAGVEDCRTAVRWLRKNADKYGYDGKKIGAIGRSAGGHLAAMLGALSGSKTYAVGDNLNVSGDVQAVVDYFGPTDFLQMDKQNKLGGGPRHDSANSPESKWLGGPIQERKELAAKANPITYLHAKMPPFLIIHGEDDRVVPIGQSEILRDAMKKRNLSVEYMAVPGQGHGIRSEEASRKEIEFLKKHLG